MHRNEPQVECSSHIYALVVPHKVSLERRHPEQELVRSVHGTPTARYVEHVGYVSLFPLLAKLLPCGSRELESTLLQMADPALLWTPYGLRSLAPTSSIYMVNSLHATAADGLFTGVMV